MLDEAFVASWLAESFRACLGTRALCQGNVGDARSFFTALGEVGSLRSAPLLWRLEVRGVYLAGRTLDRLLTREMGSTLGPCLPPAPAATDEAYFLSAVTDSVALPTVPEARMTNRAPEPLREALFAELEDASLRGDLQAVARSARAYLATLGHPGPLRVDLETSWGLHGGRHARVREELARVDEILGEVTEAAGLYRQGPGSATCGTGAVQEWQRHVGGLIRAEERVGGCARIVAQRLLEIDPSDPALGTARLREAGFDVESLYRGALTAPGWEQRVQAIEGLADSAGVDAIPLLLDRAASGDAQDAKRSLSAIGDLANRQCSLSDEAGVLGGVSSEATRTVHSAERDCTTPFRDEFRADLARKLLPFAQRGDPFVRKAAIYAMGQVGSTSVQRDLETLTRDLTPDPGTCRVERDTPDDEEGPDAHCVPIQGIREEAESALQTIASMNAPPPSGDH